MAKGGKREGAGRPKGFAALEAEKAREYICERLKEELGPIVDKAIEQAKEGDKYAREWLVDRGYGKVPNQVDFGDGEGELIIKWGSPQKS